MKKVIRGFAASCFLVSAILFSFIGYYQSKLPDNFYVNKNQELEFTDKNLTSSSVVSYEKTSLAGKNIGASQNVSLKLCGVIPVKETRVSVVKEQYVTPGGTPFGIKLFTKGVIVVDVSSVQTDTKLVIPAKEADIQKGDIILTANDMELFSNEQFAEIIANSSGNKVVVNLIRDNVNIRTVITPVKSAVDGSYKCGIWVRDSSAGIGTVTYYDAETGNFGGLGHGICDVDTGKIMPISLGETCKVKIMGVLKGQVGTAGELQGKFVSTDSNGTITLNNEAGVFGTLNQSPNNFNPMPIKFKQEVQKGKATIYTTIDENGPKEYEINIDKVDLDPKTLTKNIVITVTDKELLEKAGGIIQGMSGSPIIQDGKLVGAVTHVFINNPTKGYGIFAENMIIYSNTLAK